MEQPATGHDIVVIGASAGGVDAVSRLLGQLPADLPASLLVVIHLPAHLPSSLPEILQRATSLRVVRPVDPTPVERGSVYVGIPNRHLLLVDSHVRVVNGPRENRHRPAIDPLFRSAAWTYGPRVVGVVLTGTLDDGAAGLWAVRSCGGVAVVQSPSDALHPEMPGNALRSLDVDHVLPLDQIGPLLERLAHQPPPRHPPPSPAATRLAAETASIETGLPVEAMKTVGTTSPFTCPGCGGALWELHDGGILRYRCHVGHAYPSDGLQSAKSEQLEQALYSAVQIMEEKAALARRLDEHYGNRLPAISSRYQEQAHRLEQDAAVLRRLLIARETP